MKVIIVNKENEPEIEKAFSILVRTTDFINKDSGKVESTGSLAHLWLSLEDNGNDIDTLSLFTSFGGWDKFISGPSETITIYFYNDVDNIYFGFFAKDKQCVIKTISELTGKILTDYVINGV